MVAIFATARNQRIGDLVAGTHVVRDRHGDRHPGPAAALPRIAPGPARTWDVSAVSADDLAAVRAFLERRDALRLEARNSIAAELASRLRPRVRGVAPNVGDETFLELLAAVKAARS
jgi:hypothetical protein